MKIRCVWEHNGDDSILYSADFAGAFTRDETRATAIQKMPLEIRLYLKGKGDPAPDSLEAIIVQEKDSGLAISDADTEILFDEGKRPLELSEYEELKVMEAMEKSGRQLLRKQFRTVERRDYKDALAIDSTEDYIEYIYSMASLQGLDRKNYDILLNYFNSKKVNGYLHVPKEYGMFVAGNA